MKLNVHTSGNFPHQFKQALNSGIISHFRGPTIGNLTLKKQQFYASATIRHSYQFYQSISRQSSFMLLHKKQAEVDI